MIDGTYIYEDDLSVPLIATGDLFSPIVEFGITGSAGVVLTPMCDLAQEKVDRVKVAVAIPLKSYLEQILIPEIFRSEKEYREEIEQNPAVFGQSYLNDKDRRVDAKTLRLVKEMQRILRNVTPRKPSHYYLPGKHDPARGFLVDFSFILSVPGEKLRQGAQLLRLKSPWREQLLSRYVAYSSRVGVLDYSDECICKTIQAFYPELSAEQIYGKMK
jgi:hypothetical protein